MTAPATIEAVTDPGTGLILPLAKAFTHLWTIYTAITRGWPLSILDATAELEEAQQHIRSTVIPHELMTADCVTVVHDWIGELNRQTSALQGQINFDEDISQTPTVDDLKDLSRNMWQLLTTLDRELTGLEPNSTDPGRQP